MGPELEAEGGSQGQNSGTAGRLRALPMEPEQAQSQHRALTSRHTVSPDPGHTHTGHDLVTL